MAGQYVAALIRFRNPRGVTLPSYRGDIINNFEFTEAAVDQILTVCWKPTIAVVNTEFTSRSPRWFGRPS